MKRTNFLFLFYLISLNCQFKQQNSPREHFYFCLYTVLPPLYITTNSSHEKSRKIYKQIHSIGRYETNTKSKNNKTNH